MRVDDVRWEQVASLDTAGAGRRAWSRVREDDEGIATSSPATARTARGCRRASRTSARPTASGSARPARSRAGQLSLLPRRPLGIRGGDQPGPGARLGRAGAARRGARQCAAGASGRSTARSRSPTTATSRPASPASPWPAPTASGTAARRSSSSSLLGPGAAPVGDGLLADLGAALAAARDPASRFVLLRGEVVAFGVRVEVAHDPAHDRADVEASSRPRDALRGRARARPGRLVRARRAVIVRSTPGVLACTMPRLRRRDERCRGCRSRSRPTTRRRTSSWRCPAATRTARCSPRRRSGSSPAGSRSG